MSSTLTPKEEQITALVVKGMKNHDIANIIGTTTNMIKNYLRVIFDKTGTWTRLELALWYLKANESKTANRLWHDVPCSCGPCGHALSQFVEAWQSGPNETTTAKTIMFDEQWHGHSGK